MVRTSQRAMRSCVAGHSGTMGRSARKQGSTPLLGHGFQRGRRQDRNFNRSEVISTRGRFRGRRTRLALWTSQSYRRIRAPGLTRSGTATPTTCWCTGSRSTTCRHCFSCTIPSQGPEDLPQVRSRCSTAWTAAVDQRPSVGYDRHDCRIAEDIGRVIAMPHRFQLRRTTEQE